MPGTAGMVSGRGNKQQDSQLGSQKRSRADGKNTSRSGNPASRGLQGQSQMSQHLRDGAVNQRMASPPNIDSDVYQELMIHEAQRAQYPVTGEDSLRDGETG